MPDVLTERRGAAFWITINREERRNAINPEVIFGIRAGIEAALREEGVRAVVLTGAGDKAFCAGGDLKRGTGNFTMGLDQPQTDFGLLARTVRECWLPIVARINGACVAGGMGLMSLADLAIAADHARFGLPEARVGVFPMQVLVYLRHLVGLRHLNELCLTGALIDARRAREIGLVNDVVPGPELDAAVDRLLGTLAEMSPVALRRGKHVIAVMESMPFEQALSYAEAQIGLASRTEDAEEGLAAFNEKRRASWVPTDG
jgi:enoyl-CoA hydratase/carnithine racemase